MHRLLNQLIRLSLVCVAALLLCLSAANAQRNGFDRYQFTTFDFPGAQTQSAINGLNEYGEFVGVYDDAQGNFHGFLGSKDSRKLTRFDYPGAVQTYLAGINETGTVSGTYFDKQGHQHGFVAIRFFVPFFPVVFISLDDPKAAFNTQFTFEFGTGLGTSAYGLNNFGEVAGQYADVNGAGRGFVLSGGQYHTYDAPGASLRAGDGVGTVLVRINDRGDLAGSYGDAQGRTHGLVLSDRKFTTIDPPGSTFTQCFGLNALGDTSGFYIDGTGIGHGYILHQGGYTIFDAPGSMFLTTVADLNSQRELVGEYYTADGLAHGYLALPRH